jgi:hypothetical protein
VNVVYGSTALKLTKPAGKSLLVVASRKGDWNVRLGDQTAGGMSAAFLNGAAITNGSGGWPIKDGTEKTFVVPVGDVTVKGYAADSELAYFWA